MGASAKAALCGSVSMVLASLLWIGCGPSSVGDGPFDGGTGDTDGGGGGGAGSGGTGGTGGSGGSGFACGEPPSGAVVIEDQDFDDANWTLTVAQTEGATVSTDPTGRLSSGGLDGSAYRSMTHEITNPSLGEHPSCTAEDGCSFSIVVTHQYQLGSYTPATDGAISHIDYSEAHVITEPAFEGAAVGWTFAIWQDGIRYILDPASRPSTAFRDVAWATESNCGLTPESFTPAGLNFADGSTMTFGYLRSNTNTSAGTTQRNVHGIDDFRVVIAKAN